MDSEICEKEREGVTASAGCGTPEVLAVVEAERKAVEDVWRTWTAHVGCLRACRNVGALELSVERIAYSG